MATTRAASAAKRPRAPKPSCFVLELSADPGGSRRSDIFVYDRIEHLRAILEQELLDETRANVTLAAYLAIAYGERMLVWVVQAGAIVDVVDLHPFVRACWRESKSFVALDDKAGLATLVAAYDGTLGDELDVHFAIDWTAIERRLPALEGALLLPTETMRLSDPGKRLRTARSCLTTGDAIAYGYSDLEERREPPSDWEDPDPPGRREP